MSAVSPSTFCASRAGVVRPRLFGSVLTHRSAGSTDIINEHLERPIGKHRDQLERVLTYLRKNHLEMGGKYIPVCTEPHEEWRIASISGEQAPLQPLTSTR
jgi:hypothetical protein